MSDTDKLTRTEIVERIKQIPRWSRVPDRAFWGHSRRLLLALLEREEKRQAENYWLYQALDELCTLEGEELENRFRELAEEHVCPDKDEIEAMLRRHHGAIVREVDKSVRTSYFDSTECPRHIHMPQGNTPQRVDTRLEQLRRGFWADHFMYRDDRWDQPDLDSLHSQQRTQIPHADNGE